MVGFAVVLDTCTLYPAHLRDTLLRLAELGLCQPLWSADILRELSTNLDTIAKIDRHSIQNLLEEMSKAFPEANVDGYDGLIDSMACDPKDRHVLATAVRSGAGAIVTFNLSDFPEVAIAPYEIDVIHPDSFLMDLLDLAPYQVVNELERQAEANRRSPRTFQELLEALSKLQLSGFVDEVRCWRVSL